MIANSHPSRFTPFTRFIGSRGLIRHFHRLGSLEATRGHDIDRSAHPADAGDLRRASRSAAEAVFSRLGSRPAGLTAHEAARLLRRHGPNEVAREAPVPWWRALWLAYRDPFNLLLSALAGVSLATGDLRSGFVILAMVLLSVGLRFVQESRSRQAALRLKAMVAVSVSVFRPSATEPTAIPIAALVPGDLVHLAAGDLVPADCRLVSARDFFVSESALTGEALPVEKSAAPSDQEAADLALPNIVYMGTHVLSGSAQALVVATGPRTYFGTLAGRLIEVQRAPTQFQAGVNRVSLILVRFMLVMVPAVFVFSGLAGHGWGESLLFALSVAVGLTPEMLPMIATTTLARGAVALARRKVVVKRLDAIQNFGAMDLLCTDKTGTLTRDEVVLDRYTDAWGVVSGEVLLHAWLNSRHQTGLTNLLDVAVLARVEARRDAIDTAGYAKVDEIPFDFTRRRMSVIVAVPDGSHRLVCKGAVAEVLAACTRVRRGGADLPLTADLLAQVSAFTAGLNDEGLRVVAVAVREAPPAEKAWHATDEAHLTLLGFVAFLDPPKESAAPALEALAARGVAVKVLTGDNPTVAAHVCRQVGLEPGRPLEGEAIDAMDDAALAVAVRDHTLFARLAPLAKERIVRALRAQGRVVGFLGDGVNDAAALHAADIGISVDTGADVAREAADIILLEKNLLVLADGVSEGRRTFANMLKYIRMTASSNFGNVFSVLAASLMLPFLPMLPVHLLLQNLLYDIAQTAIPFDRVDPAQTARPLAWQPDAIVRFMLVFGPVSSLFDLSAFAILWWVFDFRDAAHAAAFQTGWFVVGLSTQLAIVLLMRGPGLDFRNDAPAPVLVAATLGALLAGIAIAQGPLAASLRMTPLPAPFFVWCLVNVAAYLAVAQWLKNRHVRRHGWP